MLLKMSKTIDKLYCVSQKTKVQQQNRPAAHFGAQRPRVPGHSVGLGRESGPRSNPTWAESGLGGARTPLAVGSNPTAIHDSRAIKTGHRTAPIKP